MNSILPHLRYKQQALALLGCLMVMLTLSVAAAPVQAQTAGSTISGRVFDRSNGQSLPGAIISIGFENLHLATVTDAAGRYSISGVPATKNLDIITFLAGYTYLLQNRDVGEGQRINLDFGIIVQPDPNLIPKISDPKISVNSAEPGQEVTFSLNVKQGSEVPLSPEVMVMNPVIGRSVLLKPAGGETWTGTFKIPDNLPNGNYAWTFFATDEACREPNKFPVLNLAVTAKQFFPETNKTVPGAFLYYWNTHGGLPIYGYPISEAAQEVNPSDGKTYLVQYFERNRFEYHSENAGTPYEILLGLLGKQVTAGREKEAPFQPIAAFPNTPDKVFFPDTGHSLGSASAFKPYWDKYGGLAQFGFPITEEFQERNADDGKTYIVQYFERARFEYHPENKGTPYEVLLGLLGKQIYKGQ